MNYTLFLFNPKHFNDPNCSINMNSNIISPNDSAKILSIIFQSDLSMDKQISAIVKIFFLQLRNFHHICPFIYKTATITIEYFYSPPKYSIHCLHKLQNTTALKLGYSLFSHYAYS